MRREEWEEREEREEEREEWEEREEREEEREKCLQLCDVTSHVSPSMPTSRSGGMFSFFKTLTGGKTISMEMMAPALERMKEHLVTKNVAMEIAEKLCDSVAAKLDGKVIGTFTGEREEGSE